MRTGGLVVIGLALLGLGLLLGLIPGEAKGYAGQSYSCGSPWNRDDSSIGRQTFQDELSDTMSGMRVQSADYTRKCDEALQTRTVFAWMATGLGVVVLAGFAFVSVTRKPEGQAVEPDNSTH